MECFLITILFSLSLAANLFLIWIVSNLYNQVQDLKQELTKVNTLDDDLVRYHEILMGIFTRAYADFERVDKRGSFSSDDEIGWSFKLLKDVIKDVQENLKSIYDRLRTTTPGGTEE